jgi:hypothetical protein
VAPCNPPEGDGEEKKRELLREKFKKFKSLRNIRVYLVK